MLRSPSVARLAAAISSLLIAVGSLTACGSSGAAPNARTAASSAPKAGAFPVTIKHKFGETTIPAEPQRIVTVGLTDQDPVLALGKVPVGTTEWFGNYPGAIGPWASDRLKGAALPTVLKDTGSGPQVEKIAALRPDLILALYAGLTKEQYQTLSKFAPVLVQPTGVKDWAITWQDQTMITGRALGKEEEAAKLVAAVDEKFTAARAANPEFQGKSAIIGILWQGYFVMGGQDSRSRVLTSLGFTIPSELDSLTGDKFGANISKERTDLLDQDVTLWSVADVAKDSAKLHGEKVYGDLGVVKEAREIYIDEKADFGVAFSFVTVLGLPYILDRLVPQLKAAVDGDPATKVEPPTS